MAQIEFHNVSYSYDGATPALSGVSLQIQPGQFICVLGGNGCGKSTFAKHVNALLVPDGGSVEVLGCPTDDASQTNGIRSNVGMVFQNPDDQIVASLVEDDVAFGPSNLGVPSDELRQRVTDALQQVGLAGFERRDVSTLSGGQKQLVAIAGALAMKPQILVLDEPSAMLDPRGRAHVLELCHRLNQAGLTIVLITHFMEEAVGADRVIVLDRGQVALSGIPAEVLLRTEELRRLNLHCPFAAELSHELRARRVPVDATADLDALVTSLEGLLPDGGSDAHQDIRRHRTASPAPAEGRLEQPDAQPVLEFRAVSFSYDSRPQPSQRPRSNASLATESARSWALHDISLSLAQGELLGIAGHTGSGKSTLMQLSNGLLQPTLGSVIANGRDLASKRAAAEARRSIGVVFQYPERQLFASTVFDDVAFGPRNLGLSAEETETRVREALELVHLPFEELRQRSPFALSGGQQRRVALAGILAMKPGTLVLDEPAAGLDPRAHEALLGLVRQLNGDQRLSVILISHDMDDLARLCDRIVILNEGEIYAKGLPDDVFADEGRLHAAGLDVPHSLHVSNALGLSLPSTATAESVADVIAARYSKS